MRDVTVASVQSLHHCQRSVVSEALADANRVVIDPDYNSMSGCSVRIIGYSMLAEALVTVIVLSDGGE